MTKNTFLKALASLALTTATFASLTLTLPAVASEKAASVQIAQS